MSPETLDDIRWLLMTGCHTIAMSNSPDWRARARKVLGTIGTDKRTTPSDSVSEPRCVVHGDGPLDTTKDAECVVCEKNPMKAELDADEVRNADRQRPSDALPDEVCGEPILLGCMRYPKHDGDHYADASWTGNMDVRPRTKEASPMRRWCSDPECLSFDCSTCIEVNAMSRVAARCVAIESAAGFVVRRAELAPEGSPLRERIEALRKVLDGEGQRPNEAELDSPNFVPDELKALAARGYERVNMPARTDSALPDAEAQAADFITQMEQLDVLPGGTYKPAFRVYLSKLLQSQRTEPAKKGDET